MKVINSKIAAIGLAAFFFASCSDSNSDPTGPTPNVELAETITANLTSSSAAELAARVSNYKNTTANARKFFFSRATQTRAFASADKVFSRRHGCRQDLFGYQQDYSRHE